MVRHLFNDFNETVQLTTSAVSGKSPRAGGSRFRLASELYASIRTGSPASAPTCQDVIREMLFQIGIQHANVRLGEPGALELQRQITGSLADPEPASLLSRYLDHLLDGIARRKTSKLLAHRDPVDERHLFIWITESSPMDIAAMLRDVPEDLQSHVAPNLPEGITKDSC
jgi:hypothetical protein